MGAHSPTKIPNLSACALASGKSEPPLRYQIAMEPMMLAKPAKKHTWPSNAAGLDKFIIVLTQRLCLEIGKRQLDACKVLISIIDNAIVTVIVGFFVNKQLKFVNFKL